MFLNKGKVFWEEKLTQKKSWQKFFQSVKDFSISFMILMSRQGAVDDYERLCCVHTMQVDMCEIWKVKMMKGN